MKVTVNEVQPVNQEIKVGMIVSSLEKERIILVTGVKDEHFSGVTLYKRSTDSINFMPVGKYSNGWILNCYKPFIGTITLQND